MGVFKYKTNTKTWDPRLPNLQAINMKHWRSMKNSDNHLKKVFPEPPLIAYKRQKNIKDYVVRAKIPPTLTKNPRRKIPGMRKCGRQCHVCPYIKEEKEIQCGEVKWKLNKPLNCNAKNVIYMIECSKCHSKYIGETERELKDRISDHKTYIRSKKLNQPVGEHFNLPGHSIDNLPISFVFK